MNYSLKKTGFTLIEMLIVISLVAIISTLAYVSVGGTIREAALDNSYATVITALESARNRAMQGVGDGSGGQTVTVSGDGRSVTTESTTVQLSPNVSILENGTSITFDRITGRTSATTFTIEDSNGENRTINITDQGYVY